MGTKALFFITSRHVLIAKRESGFSVPRWHYLRRCIAPDADRELDITTSSISLIMPETRRRAERRRLCRERPRRREPIFKPRSNWADRGRAASAFSRHIWGRHAARHRGRGAMTERLGGASRKVHLLSTLSEPRSVWPGASALPSIQIHTSSAQSMAS
jgi:hypothetical protein